jgi:urease accessory protein
MTLTARSILPAGSWDRAGAVDSVTLAWDERHRRRFQLRSDGGMVFLLDLARPARLAQDDGLRLDDGRVVAVTAAPEPVLEIRAGTTGLARLAYHLGNRHLDLQIAGDILIVRADAVIADMVHHLGGEVREALRPFTPEPGAYDGAPSHAHGHTPHGHQLHD